MFSQTVEYALRAVVYLAGEAPGAADDGPDRGGDAGAEGVPVEGASRGWSGRGSCTRSAGSAAG